jgi:hypothetical protein
VPYTATTLLQSYGIVLKYINHVGLGERDPFECPLVAARQDVLPIAGESAGESESVRRVRAS